MEMNDEINDSDRAYIIELLAAGDVEGLKAFRDQSKPTPIRFYCQVLDGINDNIFYNEYGVPLSPAENLELNKPQVSSGNRRYLPQITAISICYSSVEQMQKGLLEKYEAKCKADKLPKIRFAK